MTDRKRVEFTPSRQLEARIQAAVDACGEHPDCAHLSDRTDVLRYIMLLGANDALRRFGNG